MYSQVIEDHEAYLPGDLEIDAVIQRLRTKEGPVSIKELDEAINDRLGKMKEYVVNVLN